jgi:hypothetical protein
VTAYFDDILIASSSIEEHVEQLEQTLKQLHEAGIRLKKSKAKIAYDSVKYLGFIISHNTYQPDPAKIDAILHLPRPSNLKALRRFMGMCGFYQQFIRDYAQLLQPLLNLTKKDAPWIWTDVHESTFNKLKIAISDLPSLTIFNPELQLELSTDASTTHVAAVLHQLDEHGRRNLIACASRTLTSPESRYFTQELECLAVIFGLQKFRPYLLGRKFTLATDHQALLSVLTKKSPSSRITRWSLAMQEYDFTIVHVPGRLNFVSDTLSRPDHTPATLMSIQQSPANMPLLKLWIQEQLNDTFCQDTTHLINASNVNRFNDFYIDDVSKLLLLHTPGSQPRLVVPNSLIDSVFTDVHEDPTAAHQGIRKTLSRVAAAFFWPGWRNDIIQRIRTCKSCQQRKDPPAKAHPKATLVSSQPNELVAMDIMGPLVTTSDNNQFLLIMQDHFTKFVVAVPIKNCTSEIIADVFLKHWVAYFQAPIHLITDNAQYFSSSLMFDLYGLLKIHKIFTSPYHPQSDFVERVNRTFNAMISHYLSTNQDDWDLFVPFLTLAFNSTFNFATGYSPFYLRFGYHPKTLVDTLASIPSMRSNTGGGGMKDAMHFALSAAYNQLIIKHKNRHSVQEAINQTMKYHEYKVGDQVMLYVSEAIPGLKMKHVRRWTGPFKIIDNHGQLSFIVQSLDGQNRYRAHREHLKPVMLPSKPQFDQNPNWPKNIPTQGERAQIKRRKKGKKAQLEAGASQRGGDCDDTHLTKTLFLA